MVYNLPGTQNPRISILYQTKVCSMEICDVNNIAEICQLKHKLPIMIPNYPDQL